MNKSVETKCSTGGRNGITRKKAATRRLAVFIVALLLAIGIVASINTGTRQRLAQLEGEFAAIQSERFLLGLHARESQIRMNAALLRYQLSGVGAEQMAFHTTKTNLNERLNRTIPQLHTALEQEAAQRFETAHRIYLKQTEELIERPIRGIRKDTAAQVHQMIEEHSAPALTAAEELIRAQQMAWTKFFGQSQSALASLQYLIWFSAAVLLVFLALLTALAHRAFIAPLQVQLTETKAIVERQEKLASLGILAAGVAHEIRNPLTAIKMRLFSLKKSLPEEVARGEDLSVVHAEVNRLERIVKETLQFARPSEPARAAISAAELFQEVVKLLGRELTDRGVQLQTEAKDDLHFTADRQQLLQVLINLVQNAGESIGQNGTVSLKARTDMMKMENVSRPAVVLEVSDTGKGISPEAERRLFDPFYSTKEGGTGLGLAIAARIVEKHGGLIQYSPSENRGATFTIVLPRDSNNES